jgi:hypothetical protein
VTSRPTTASTLHRALPVLAKAGPFPRPISICVALLTVVPLSVLVALRGDTRDTSNYIDVYRLARTFPWDPLTLYAEEGMEWGFWLLSWLLNLFDSPPAVLFFVISLITFLFLQRAAGHVQLKLLEVIPYYIGTFFLVQQLMQIRQGVGAAFSLWVIVGAATRRHTVWRFFGLAFAGTLAHFTTLLPLLATQVLMPLTPRPSRARLTVWCLAVVVCAITVARLFMSFELIEQLGRLSLYAVDEEYNAERGLLAPANVRAFLFLVMFLCFAPHKLLCSRSYVLMLGLYAAHLGFRLGFFDFLILSGRLSTALGFVEVLMFPMLTQAAVHVAWVRCAIALIYMAVHLSITLTLQAPYLIDDYFTPLQLTGS